MSTKRISDNDENFYWRFDAVDLRAGIGFAAWRKDIANDSVPAEMPAVHFSPPFFSPEPVANIALALGATRGSMRSELLINGREAWFETLEEVGEFLRRAYVASGGGDGADGSGDSDPSPPLPEPPDLPNRSKDDDEFSESPSAHKGNAAPASLMLAHFATDLEEQISQLETGKSCSFSLSKAEDSDGLQDLQAGATHVLCELLMRWPGEASDPDNHLRWLGNFRSWWASVNQLGLRSLLFNSGNGSLQPLLRNWASHHEPWMLQDRFDENVASLVVASLLHGSHRLREAIEQIQQRNWKWAPFGYPHTDLFLAKMHAIGVSTPVSIATLRSFPLPHWAWNFVGSDLKGRASLYHLLCTLTAQPQLTNDRRHFEILLFACACVVGGPHNLSTEFSFWELDADFGPSKVEINQVRQTATEAIQWLREHLPSRSFSKAYEMAISGAKEIRYRH